MELLQIGFNKLGYLLDVWNWIELSHYIGFYVLTMYSLAGVEYVGEKNTLKPLFLICLEWLFMITGFMKVLYFLRLSESLGLMVRMVSTTIMMCIPFISFFSMWILLFTILQMGLNLNVGEDDYKSLNFFSRVLLTIYRNSIGDI